MEPAVPNLDAAPAPAGKRIGAGRRRALLATAVVLALLALWAAAALYAPPLIREQAERVGTETLGRRVSLGEVAFNPWTLELTVHDVVVAGPPPEAAGDPPSLPLLRVRRIHADAAWQSLLRLAPVIDRLDIDAPELRLARVAEGRFDIDDIVARMAARPSEPGPARFAVNNIVLSQGSADFVDAPAQATHQLRGVELAVPFVSSLPAQREIRVEPRLAFTLDGSRLDSSAVATPFSETGSGTIALALHDVDVSRWLGYVPRELPVQLRSALLGADLRIAFEQRPKLSLVVSGTLDVSGLAVADAGAAPLLSAGRLHLVIDELRPLEATVKLKRLEVEAPHLQAVRSAAGQVNLLLLADAPGGAAAPVARLPLPTSAASAARAAAAASRVAAAPVPASASFPSPRWKVQLAELSVRAGRLDWRDAVPVPVAALAVDAFSLDATAIQWPLDAPVVFKGGGSVAGEAGRGRFEFSGQGNAAGASVAAKVDGLPLGLAAPYLRPVLALPLAGRLSAAATARWAPGPGAPRVQAEIGSAAVEALQLGDAQAPDFAADRIELASARIDTVARSVAIGRLALHGPRLRLARDAKLQWNVARWAAAPGPAAASTPAPAPAPAPALAASSSSSSSAPRLVLLAPASSAASALAAPPPPPPWKLSLGQFALDKGRLGFVDQGLAVPVALDVSELALDAGGLALDSSAKAPFHLRARLVVPAGPSGSAVGSGFAGSIDARGEIGPTDSGVPGSVQAALQLKDLPLHLLDPYLDELLDIDVQKAQTSFKGSLDYAALPAGPRVALRGDATVDDFRANSPLADRGGPQRSLAMVREGGAGRQLLGWKTLSLRGVELAVAPGTATRLAVTETALSDFFARVVLDESGHLNLQDVSRPPRAAAATASGASGVAAAASSAPRAAADKPAPVIAFGPISVAGGRVAFADRFVKPNYSANLSELAGKLGAFSSAGAAPGQPPQLAALELRGRVEGTATLEITGQANPLARPLALDVKAKVRDLELPPLSPYAIKYAGYGIERGKLSVDLAYLVRPDGQLTASNKIVLNQLAFGDKVEGAPASLPVKLAVALLADRHGVIDLDLPVSGSINDPQFSLGGVIWKVVTNLIVKAVTSPFSLLASALGGSGGTAASTVEFAPGTAVLTPAAKESLDKVATALAERPQLTMTVTGESRLDVEREAWKKDRLQQIVRAEKRRAGIAGGAAAGAEVVVSDAEYPSLLKEVYKRADIVKPKNAAGLAAELTPAEMEALLLGGIVVTEESMQQLAVRRGVAVRDYLASRQLPTRRLFLGAPRTASSDEKWVPRADLKLATD